MKKVIAFVLTLALTICLFAACGKNTDSPTNAAVENTDNAVAKQDKYVIGVPNDTTNEARALMLLESLGFIKLKAGAGITATKLDIEENPYNIEIMEIEASQVPQMLSDTDFSVINSNYALDAGLDPKTQALAQEGFASAYSNIVAVKEGNEKTAKTKALVAALSSKLVADFITEQYNGSVVTVIENPGDGFDTSVDYESLKGETIKVAASPNPHAEILTLARDILAQKGVTLEIIQFTDYIQPNEAVESGEVDANYFQHIPYMDDFNEQNGTHLVSVGAIHVEPMGIYGGKLNSLDVFA